MAELADEAVSWIEKHLRFRGVIEGQMPAVIFANY